MQEAVAILTVEGCIVYCNPGLAKLLGASERDLPGQPVTAFLRAVDRRIFAQLLLRAARGNAEREFSIVRPDKQVVRARFLLSPAAGEPAGYCLIARNVGGQTGRQSAERRLIAAQDAAEIGTWSYQISTSRLHWSAQNFRLYGLEPREGPLAFDDWLQRIDERDRDRVAQQIRALRRKGRFTLDFRIVRPDGGRRRLQSRGQVLSGSRGPWVLGASQDVTDLTAAEESLRSTEERFRTVFDHSPLGISVADPEGRFLQANRAYCELTGYTEKELLERDFQSITHPEDVGPNLRLHHLALAGKISHYEMQKRYIRKDGGTLWGRMHVAVVVDGHGRVGHFMSLLEDIGERKRADDSIRVMTDSLQRLSRRLLHLQDEERRRIARELHDGMGQSLTALKMNVERLHHSGMVTGRMLPVAEESVELAAQLCREVRSLSYLLHPPLLDELGLESALRAYTKGVSERTGIAIDLDLPRDFGRLAPELETTIFRIVQEGLANIHRHSGSAKADLKLERGAAGITLHVRDYGRGLSPEADLLRGVGLAGIRERTSQINGTFDIRAAHPGVKLTVMLPLETGRSLLV